MCDIKYLMMQLVSQDFYHTTLLRGCYKYHILTPETILCF